jgi:hypothetical protein
LAILAWLGLLAAGLGTSLYLFWPPKSKPREDSKTEVDSSRALAKEIDRVCTACHAYPSPKNFPRWAWKAELDQAYGFVTDPSSAKSKLAPMKPPPFEEVVNFFERHAPLELPPAIIERAARPYGVQFAVSSTPDATDRDLVSISNVQLARLTKDGPLELVACEMRAGLVLAMRPDDPKPTWRTLAKVDHPARVEVIDLRGEGIIDLLVADLGTYLPADDKKGKVIWLAGDGKGNFTPHTLIDGLGRVADVRAADFRGTGKKDLIVASFGFRRTGEVLFLENQTTDWNNPRFVPRVLDDRHGAIHVPIADLNGDGKPDFVVLFAQEHERVEAFINDGHGNFTNKVIYEANDPSYGSSGIQLVDLDGDGKVDVLYTNGDVLDFPRLLKPYHAVRWLKNTGSYPYEHHLLTPMYGVHAAVAADLRGKGVMDIVAVSFLPENSFPSRKEKNIDSVIVLEQTAPGQFARHTLETGTCDHVSCAVGPVYDPKRNDLIIGNFETKKGTPVRIWKNLGPRPAEAPKK